MKRFYWIWIVLSLALFAGGAYLASGDISIFLDLASFIITFIIAFLLSLSFSGPKEMASYVKQARETTPLNMKIAKQGIVYFQSLQNLIILSGLSGFFIALVVILRNIADKTSVGKGLGTSLLVVLYALLLSVLITQPFIAALKKKIADKD